MKGLILHDLTPKRKNKVSVDDNGYKHNVNGKMVTIRAACKELGLDAKIVRSDIANNDITLEKALNRCLMRKNANDLQMREG